jgi:hypothetical protein
MNDPNFDEMTPKQVREWGEKLSRNAQQFGEIQAMLIVNCQPGRMLDGLGIRYDESKTVLNNLIHILESLAFPLALLSKDETENDA